MISAHTRDKNIPLHLNCVAAIPEKKLWSICEHFLIPVFLLKRHRIFEQAFRYKRLLCVLLCNNVLICSLYLATSVYLFSLFACICFVDLFLK